MRIALFGTLLLAACTHSPTVPPPDLSTTISCGQDSDCPADLPTCDPAAKICTGCFPEMNTCPQGTLCDATLHVCVQKAPGDPECTRNADCPPIGEISQRSICALDLGVCVECLIDDDCADPAKPVCDNGSNQGVPDLGRTPTYSCIDGCQLCVPPLPVCDRANARCLPAMDGGVDGG